MKRRDFVTGIGAGALTAGLAGCAGEQSAAPGAACADAPTLNWKMVTTWPPNFPGLGRGAANLARRIEEVSGGRIKVHVYAAGELVPPFEVFDAVSQGTAELGHGAAYYWKGKVEAGQFFTSIPFGLNSHEMNGWLFYGGGMDLWRETYDRFNLVPHAAGNTGVQMGGWFNKPIETFADLDGLKMRIPGLGGEVLRRAGGTPVSLPGGEIFTALQTGNIDATEWVGPYNDVAFGLNKAARYYYYPGWHEPGPTLECIVNKDAWASLPPDLQAVIAVASQSINNDMRAEFAYRDAEALQTILADPDIEVRRFPQPVLERLKEITRDLLDEMSARDPLIARIRASQEAFLERSAVFQSITERAYLEARDGPVDL
ncbi:TRAP transporter substrate-binding protein [Lentisalinibacter sediminis]|uniref:TRAP transporter substrate-binding protein n=1 Tax=Lentisalinibacter sediminis TaxID=2992237 RepID=UPI0038689C16